MRPLKKRKGNSSGAELSLFDYHGRGRIPFHEMNITIVLRDEYAILVLARLGSYHSTGLSILPVNLSVAVGKWIVIFRKPDSETVNATMPNHLGACIDGQRLDKPVRTFSSNFDNLCIDLRVCRRLLWGCHIDPFLIVLDVRLFAEMVDV
jgi:hypothetical protein